MKTPCHMASSEHIFKHRDIISHSNMSFVIEMMAYIILLIKYIFGWSCMRSSNYTKLLL